MTEITRSEAEEALAQAEIDSMGPEEIGRDLNAANGCSTHTEGLCSRVRTSAKNRGCHTIGMRFGNGLRSGIRAISPTP